MKKVLIIILALGVAGFFIFKKDKMADQEPGVLAVDESSQEFGEETFTEKTTLLDLAKKGGDYKCTFSQSTSLGNSTGVIYISGKNIRGDFISEVSIPSLSVVEKVDTYMISDGESVYTWSSMSPDGFKAPVVEDSKNANNSNLNNPSMQQLDYKCVSWKVDESVFKIPNNITFKTTL